MGLNCRENLAWGFGCTKMTEGKFFPNTARASYNNGQKYWDNFVLLVLLSTRQTRIQLHLPNLSPTLHTMLKTTTCNFSLFSTCFTTTLILAHLWTFLLMNATSLPWPFPLHGNEVEMKVEVSMFRNMTEIWLTLIPRLFLERLKRSWKEQST